MNRYKWNRIKDVSFKYFAILCTVAALSVLALLLYTIFYEGLQRLNWRFLTSLPSRFPERSGIITALAGMISILVLTILIAFPVGISAAIYLEEYGIRNRFAKFIEV